MYFLWVSFSFISHEMVTWHIHSRKVDNAKYEWLKFRVKRMCLSESIFLCPKTYFPLFFLFNKKGLRLTSHCFVCSLETFFSSFFRLRPILDLFSPFFHVMLLENYSLFNGVNGNLFIFVWKWWHNFVVVYTWLNNDCGRLDPFLTRSVPFFIYIVLFTVFWVRIWFALLFLCLFKTNQQ